jgi:hypothetical protein
MTRPTNKQVAEFEFENRKWDLNSLIGYVLKNNGIFVTFCIALICFNVWDKRERDIQMLQVLQSNGRILNEVTNSLVALTKSVSENDLRDQLSLSQMHPSIELITRDLDIIKNEIQRKQ